MLATEIAFSTIGLTLDIVGAVLLFTYGPPPGVLSKEAGTVLLWGIDNREQEQRKIDRHIVIGRAAIGLIVVGFMLQLIAQFLPPC